VHAISDVWSVTSTLFTTRMPKRSSKVRLALENLGQYAKKRKVSAQADKENKVNIGHTQIFRVIEN
jgi:hypothetical protein